MSMMLCILLVLKDSEVASWSKALSSFRIHFVFGMGKIQCFEKNTLVRYFCMRSVSYLAREDQNKSEPTRPFTASRTASK
jgi:hypothetical protein